MLNLLILNPVSHVYVCVCVCAHIYIYTHTYTQAYFFRQVIGQKSTGEKYELIQAVCNI